MTPALRISLGIVALSTSLLLVADSLFTIFPQSDAPELEARKNLSEALAVQYSSLVTTGRLKDMQPAMDAVIRQMPEVLSMRLRDAQGRPLAMTREHAQHWQDTGRDVSTPTQVLVPIFNRDERWGALEVRFEDLPSDGILGVLQDPLYKLLALMSAGGFLVYLLYLSRTLRYLDPSSVVPSRVRAALDQLVEGIFILDHEQRIVLANSAFANKVGLSPDSLLGADPSDLPWIRNKEQHHAMPLPWVEAIHNGSRITDRRIELDSPSLGIRVFTVNVSPIVDGAGKKRGAMASFDDISEVERINKGLQQAMENIEAANAEISAKNDELFRLATEDPLTGCSNRRAFFERFESEFELSVRDDLSLSVMMADIDHFKSINDDFGHGVGDDVIRQIADVLKSVSRVNDCVGRYGGEEFCVILVDADVEAAKEVAERARVEFARRMCQPDSATAGRPVTASFGVSALTSSAADTNKLLDQADQALYESKNNGRDQVTVWRGPDAENREAN